MSEKMLKIKYTCQHSSCVAYACKNAVLELTESEFKELSSVYEDKTVFRSPKYACLMGIPQQFKVLNVEAAGDEGVEMEGRRESGRECLARGPIAHLIEEHNRVLERVERVEEMLVKRDIEGLWIATADLDDILHLHGGIKEEEILFPAMKDLVPFGEGLVACINEDHREIVSLLHAFREALRDGTINDKVIGSSIVALRSHIRKEDNEFFEFVNQYINDEMKETIMKKMEEAERAFVPKEAGERKPDEHMAAEREKFHAKTLQSREIALDTCCH